MTDKSDPAALRARLEQALTLRSWSRVSNYSMSVVEVISNRNPDHRWWRLSFLCPRSGRQKNVATYERTKVLDAIANFRGPVLFYVWDKRREVINTLQE